MKLPLTIFSGLILLAWIVRFIFTLHCMRKARFLNPVSCPEDYPYPKLSVIIPAKDEAATVEAALTSKLASDYPDIEYIVIDDRSTDSTGSIIDAVAGRDRRVKSIHITELPAGWLGKVNALSKGTAAATGKWLLFSDADVHLSKDTLRKAVYYAEQTGLDHLGLMPNIWSNHFLVDIILAPLQDFALRWVSWESGTSRADAAVGIGAFNLVRKSAFGQTPGFEWLRLEVIDDMGLGLMMKRHGFKGAAVHGRDCAGLSFVSSFSEVLRSCDKGIFAGADFNCGIILAAVVGGALFDVVPFVLLLAGGTTAALTACACSVALAKTLLVSRWNRRPLFPALLLPFAGLLAIYLTLHSACSALLHGGIRWRDTFYSLAQLKEHKRFRLKNFY